MRTLCPSAICMHREQVCQLGAQCRPARTARPAWHASKLVRSSRESRRHCLLAPNHILQAGLSRRCRTHARERKAYPGHTHQLERSVGSTGGCMHPSEPALTRWQQCGVLVDSQVAGTAACSAANTQACKTPLYRQLVVRRAASRARIKFGERRRCQREQPATRSRSAAGSGCTRYCYGASGRPRTSCTSVASCAGCTSCSISPTWSPCDASIASGRRAQARRQMKDLFPTLAL